MSVAGVVFQFRTLRRAGVTCAMSALFAVSAEAATENVLFAFDKADGANPYVDVGLIADTGGNLYGTTSAGGSRGYGVAFELSAPTTPGGSRTQTLLHDFIGGADGAIPIAGLVADSHGNLYGTTDIGGIAGADGFGTVFELSPPSVPGGNWRETVLYRFRGESDGANPAGKLYIDEQGVLFGTTLGGNGAVFRLTPPASSGQPWHESVLYGFQGGADGYAPNGVTMIGGVLYGTTFSGGQSGTCSSNQCGTVFALKPSAGGVWTKSTVHTFGGGSDGANPAAGLIADTKGNLYGTTEYGGGTGEGCGTNGCGSVFELTPPASSGTLWTESVLYAFLGGTDGRNPVASLALRGVTLYGTTSGHLGTVFALTPASGSSWNLSVLHGFTNDSGDGWRPYGPLLYRSGAFYGMTQLGGNAAGTNEGGYGTVYDVAP
jgi:uncharacterized repeat protein (TIGR03803 family)